MPCLLMISGPTRIVYLERSFDSPEEAREYADSLGKGSATQSDDSWPLDPLWKSKTLGDCPPPIRIDHLAGARGFRYTARLTI